MNNFYTLPKKPGIYLLINKINFKKYVGKTINEIINRIKEHLRKSSKQLIDRSLRKYGIENFKIEVLAEYEPNTVSNDELLALETAFIEYFDCLHPKGYNICLASTDATGFKHSKKTRIKMSKNSAKNWLNKKRSKETCDKISLTLKDIYKIKENCPFYKKHHTKESKKKISDFSKTRDFSFLRKKVKQIDVNTNEIIKIWDSLTQASKGLDINSKNPQSKISEVCKNNRKSAYGYKWEFV